MLPPPPPPPRGCFFVFVLEKNAFVASVRRRFIYKGDTSTHADGNDPKGGMSKGARVRRHWGSLSG